MFPHIVNERMPDSRAALENMHLGPGTYDTIKQPFNNTKHQSRRHKTTFGGLERFNNPQ